MSQPRKASRVATRSAPPAAEQRKVPPPAPPRSPAAREAKVVPHGSETRLKAAAPVEPDHYTAAEWVEEAQGTAARLAATAQDLLGDLDMVARAAGPTAPVVPAPVNVSALLLALKEEAANNDQAGLALATVWAEICDPCAAACSWVVVLRQVAKSLRRSTNAALRVIDADPREVASYATDLVRVAGLAAEVARVFERVARVAAETPRP